MPKRNWLGRAVGEISKLRNLWSSTGWRIVGAGYGPTYKLDSTRVDYALARDLYDNTNDRYKLGAGFAKPIVNMCVGFMGVPRFRSLDPEAQAVLDTFFGGNVSRMQRTHRNSLREGDAYVWVTREEAADPLFPETKTRLVYNIIPPEQVAHIFRDPVTGAIREYVLVSNHEWLDDSGTTRKAKVIQRISAKRRLIQVEGDTPPDVQAGEVSNTWGFIPIVHFRNEGDEHAQFGRSDLEPLEPFFKAYHDVMMHAIQGSKLHSTPRLKLKVQDVAAFLRNNFGIEDPVRWAAENKGITLEGRDLVFLTKDEDAGFIEVQSAIGSAEPLLKFLFYCIVDTSETPEFAFGTHTPSSHASVKEQMPVLVRRVARKREHFTEAWQTLARIVLAMTAAAEGKKFATYEATLLWDEVSERDEGAYATALSTLVTALRTAVEGGLMSLDAAVPFLARYVETMNDYVSDDQEVPGERERIVRTKLLLARLEDGALASKEAEVIDRELAGEMADVQDLEGAQDPFVYLIHHIHHVAGRGRSAVEQELHHCPLFARADATGTHYTVDDLRSGDRVYHVIVPEPGQAEPPDTLYDHLGNGYRVVRKNLNGRPEHVVAGLRRGQKVVWSDAEAA